MLHLSLEGVTFPSYRILLREGSLVQFDPDNSVVLLKGRLWSPLPGAYTYTIAPLIPPLGWRLFWGSLALLPQQLQDHAFPARQIIFPPTTEDIDLCMKISFISRQNFFGSLV